MDNQNLSKIAIVSLSCIECDDTADDEARGWRMYLGADPDEPAEQMLATYCPTCAVREFGPVRELHEH